MFKKMVLCSSALLLSATQAFAGVDDQIGTGLDLIETGFAVQEAMSGNKVMAAVGTSRMLMSLPDLLNGSDEPSMQDVMDKLDVIDGKLDIIGEQINQVNIKVDLILYNIKDIQKALERFNVQYNENTLKSYIDEYVNAEDDINTTYNGYINTLRNLNIDSLNNFLSGEPDDYQLEQLISYYNNASKPIHDVITNTNKLIDENRSVQLINYMKIVFIDKFNDARGKDIRSLFEKYNTSILSIYLNNLMALQKAEILSQSIIVLNERIKEINSKRESSDKLDLINDFSSSTGTPEERVRKIKRSYKDSIINLRDVFITDLIPETNFRIISPVNPEKSMYYVNGEALLNEDDIVLGGTRDDNFHNWVVAYNQNEDTVRWVTDDTNPQPSPVFGPIPFDGAYQATFTQSFSSNDEVTCRLRLLGDTLYQVDDGNDRVSLGSILPLSKYSWSVPSAGKAYTYLDLNGGEMDSFNGFLTPSLKQTGTQRVGVPVGPGYADLPMYAMTDVGNKCINILSNDVIQKRIDEVKRVQGNLVEADTMEGTNVVYHQFRLNEGDYTQPVPVYFEQRDETGQQVRREAQLFLEQGTGREKGKSQLVVKIDGTDEKIVLWSNNTGDKDSNAYIQFQSDGNLVKYAANDNVLWASASDNGYELPQVNNKLIITTDGNMLIYNGRNEPVWQSGVACKGLGSPEINNQCMITPRF